jgi:hypothetical protein
MQKKIIIISSILVSLFITFSNAADISPHRCIKHKQATEIAWDLLPDDAVREYWSICHFKLQEAPFKQKLISLVPHLLETLTPQEAIEEFLEKELNITISDYISNYNESQNSFWMYNSPWERFESYELIDPTTNKSVLSVTAPGEIDSIFEALLTQKMLSQMELPNIKTPPLLALCTYTSDTSSDRRSLVTISIPDDYQTLYDIYDNLDTFHPIFLKSDQIDQAKEAFYGFGKLLANLHNFRANKGQLSDQLSKRFHETVSNILEMALDNDQPLQCVDWATFPKKALSYLDSLTKQLESSEVIESFNFISCCLQDWYYDPTSQDFYVSELLEDGQPLGKNLKPLTLGSYDFIKVLDLLNVIRSESSNISESLHNTIKESFIQGYTGAGGKLPTAPEQQLFQLFIALENLWFYEEDDYHDFLEDPTNELKSEFDSIFRLIDQVNSFSE